MENLEFWLSRVDQHYVCHNDFQKEVSAGINKFDRVLLSDRDAFKTSMGKFIADIHLKHKRCKPILIEYGYQSRDGKDQTYRIMSAGQTFVTMQIVSVRCTQSYFNAVNTDIIHVTDCTEFLNMGTMLSLIPKQVPYFEQNPIFGDDTDSDPYKP